MKIVFLARYLPAEGSTVQIYALAAGLIEQHHEVHVLSAGPGEDPAAKRLFAQSEAKGVQHHKVGFPLLPSFSPVGKLIQLFTYFSALSGTLWLLFRIRPDVIHVHYPVTSFIAKIFGLITHTPFVVTHHIMGIPRHPLNWRGDAAIAISSDLEKDLVERFGYSPENVHRVFNGVDTDRFHPPSARDRETARATLGFPSDELLILFVGSIEHRKGLDVLLDALSRCEVPRPHVVIMGDGDEAWLRFEGENGPRRRALVARDTEGWGVRVCSSRRVAEVSGGPRVSDPQSRLSGRSILQISTFGQIGSKGPKPTQIWTDLLREVRGDIVDNCAVGSLTSAWHNSMHGGGRTVCMSRADAYFYWRAGMGLSNDACPKVQRGSRLDRNAKW